MAQEENTVMKHWVTRKQLATGTFSTVSKVVNRDFLTDQKCLKVVMKSAINAEELAVLRQSYNVLESCAHRNIVRLREQCETSEGIYMVFDLVRGGTLFDRIAKKGVFQEWAAAKVMYQIACALEYLHGRNIIYRDLKMEHILLTEKNHEFDCILSGSDIVMQTDEPITDVAGTPGYLAPEMIKRQAFHVEIDMWACGVILFSILSGTSPFDNGEASLQEIAQKSALGDYEFTDEDWNGRSDAAKDCISQLLVVSPTNRMKASELISNDWVQSFAGKLGEI